MNFVSIASKHIDFQIDFENIYCKLSVTLECPNLNTKSYLVRFNVFSIDKQYKKPRQLNSRISYRNSHHPKRKPYSDPIDLD